MQGMFWVFLYITELIDWVRFNIPTNTLLIIPATGNYKSNDPTDSAIAMKEDRS